LDAEHDSSEKSMSSSLTATQYNVLATIGFAASSLSLFGSSCIVYIAMKRLDKFFHRVMIGLSIGDIILSTGLLLQPILIPPINPIYQFAVGNTATCSALGFMMRFPVTVAIYNCYLSLYFNFSVRNGWKESTSIRWEVAAHSFAFAVPIIFGIAGVLTESFNPLPLIHVCDFGAYPAGCAINDELDCIRGENCISQDWVNLCIILLAAAGSIWGTASVYIFVRRKTQASRRHSFRGAAALDNQKTVKDVAHQAVLYMLAYLNGILWALVTRIVFDTIEVQGKDHEPGFYTLAVLSYIFFPLQGFWNSYIYIRPRYLTWLKVNPEGTRLWAVRKVFSSEEPIEQMRSSKFFSLRRHRSGSIQLAPPGDDASGPFQGQPSDPITWTGSDSRTPLPKIIPSDDNSKEASSRSSVSMDVNNKAFGPPLSSSMEWTSSSGGRTEDDDQLCGELRFDASTTRTTRDDSAEVVAALRTVSWSNDRGAKVISGGDDGGMRKRLQEFSNNVSDHDQGSNDDGTLENVLNGIDAVDTIMETSPDLFVRDKKSQSTDQTTNRD
jgi:hypothetical protein